MLPLKRLSAQPKQIALWLEAVAAGDRRAFRLLYQATAPKLYALLRRILKQEDLAEEALQDVFVRVWVKAGSYAPGRGQPLTWLASIARYRALDLLRQRSPEVGLPEDPEYRERILYDVHRPQPEREHETMQTLDAVQDCLDSLVPEQREALTAAFFEGVSYRELSARTGVPEGTLKSRVRRGLIELRQRLHQQQP